MTELRIHADFTQRAVVRPDESAWVPSPAAGVERRMLERIGGEVARATTVVRFAPRSAFPAHDHCGGEEFLVLDGVFSDEYGDFPKGMYVRNPPGSRHAPHTREGVTIFVKLQQFQTGDSATVRVDTRTRPFTPGVVEGVSVLPLHEFGTERVALVRWQPGARFLRHAHPGGEEIYVIEGTFQDEYGAYPQGTWLRNPDGSVHTPFSEEGCLIYVKTGHLPMGRPCD